MLARVLWCRPSHCRSCQDTCRDASLTAASACMCATASAGCCECPAGSTLVLRRGLTTSMSHPPSSHGRLALCRSADELRAPRHDLRAARILIRPVHVRHRRRSGAICHGAVGSGQWQHRPRGARPPASRAAPPRECPLPHPLPLGSGWRLWRSAVVPAQVGRCVPTATTQATRWPHDADPSVAIHMPAAAPESV